MIRAATLALALCAAAPVAAQDIAPSDIPQGQGDYRAASAGDYRLDPGHSAVLARVPHMGFSYSVFRFDEVSGALTWDPGDPARNRLVAEVRLGSISTPVPGFAEVLRGPDYLGAEAHPVARFTAEGFAVESETRGTVSGRLALMGRTHPATFRVELIGAGKGYTGDEQGNPVIRDLIGVHAETEIDPQAHGLSAFFTAPIMLAIDAEFARKD